MANKVFISVLGTGNYEECKYISTKHNYISKKLSYIQEATLEYIHAAEWTNNDKAIILLTKDARKRNWEDDDRTNQHTGETKFNVGLKNVLAKMNLPISIEELAIPEGKDENEIWEIFNLLFSKINEGDELYFDLTHGFRYLPMLILVMGNYSKLLKNTKIVNITYGNFEGRDKETNEAPIVDLLPLCNLQDWSTATVSYLKNGSAKELNELCQAQLKPILNEAKGSNKSASNLKKLMSSMNHIILDRQTCRGKEIISGKEVFYVKSLIKNLEESVIQPFGPILNKIKESLAHFNDKESIYNGFEAAQWCSDNGMYQQAYTILQESTITYICELKKEKLGLDWNKEKERIALDSAFSFLVQDKITIDEWGKTDEDKNKFVRNIIDKIISDETVNELKASLKKLKDVRNDINHSGMRVGPKQSKKLIEELQDCINKIRNIVESTPPIIESKKETETNLFINFSNHPLSNWSTKQLNAAKEYGELIDLPFPQIDPLYNEEELLNLCNTCLEKIVELINYHKDTPKATVHIMGEHTMCHYIINKLQELNIDCVASTTTRVTSELENGKKEIEFHFNQFRKYLY